MSGHLSPVYFQKPETLVCDPDKISCFSKIPCLCGVDPCLFPGAMVIMDWDLFSRKLSLCQEMWQAQAEKMSRSCLDGYTAVQGLRWMKRKLRYGGSSRRLMTWKKYKHFLVHGAEHLLYYLFGSRVVCGMSYNLSDSPFAVYHIIQGICEIQMEKAQ